MSGPPPSDAKKRLVAPTLAMLPRVSDSLSFLYLEAVRVVQDDTGVCAQVERASGIDRVGIPTAAISCVLLGPGTSITQQAAATFARHGTTIVYTGAGVVRAYGSVQPANRTVDWLERQAYAWADKSDRLAVAVRMYEKRFNDKVQPGTTLAQLRGLEGQRMKALYRTFAKAHRTGRFKRDYDPDNWDDQDAVNKALSAANIALYGVVHSAILALGCSPALGFIHTGNQLSFVYDIADLYKADLTIPLAFSLHKSADPDGQARRHLRDRLRAYKLMPLIVDDIQRLLDPAAAGDRPERESQPVNLWDPEGDVASGVNYAGSEMGIE